MLKKFERGKLKPCMVGIKSRRGLWATGMGPELAYTGQNGDDPVCVFVKMTVWGLVMAKGETVDYYSAVR